MTTYSVTHVTRYEYELPVISARHLAHLRPRSSRNQRLLEFQWKAEPLPVWHESAADYFGNGTDAFEVADVHDLLEVRVQSRVEVDTPNQERLRFFQHAAWDPMSERVSQDPMLANAREYCFDSPLVRATPTLSEYAAATFAKGRSAVEAVTELCHRIHEDFMYDSAVTDASTPLAQVLTKRRGVCQDFAHVAVGALRAIGLPARYVSGYLETRPPPGRPRLRGADASHAWASVLLPEIGWLDFDPTNDVLVEDRHVTLGWGRDFSDVSPLKGIVLGGGGQRVVVQVDVEREGEKSGESAQGPESPQGSNGSQPAP